MVMSDESLPHNGEVQCAKVAMQRLYQLPAVNPWPVARDPSDGEAATGHRAVPRVIDVEAIADQPAK